MEHQQNALSLDGEPLTVEYARPHVTDIRPASRSTDTLFLGSIPFIPTPSTHALSTLLRAWTTSYGPIQRLSFVPAASPTKPGFAHVQFVNFVDSLRLYESAKIHGATLNLVPAPADSARVPSSYQRFDVNQLTLPLGSATSARSHRLYVDYQGAPQKPREKNLTPNRRLVFRNWHDSLEALTSALPRDGSVMHVKFLKVPGTGYILMRSTEDARRLVTGGRSAVEAEYSRNVLPDGKGVGGESEWEPIQVGPVKKMRERKMMSGGGGEEGRPRRGGLEAAMDDLLDTTTLLGSWRHRKS
ncbi:hypothetical protein BDZ89DRAFT_1070389 [Hymenopellis radicata]|nr:hypothetical protein BDZ89DRAFT_1070389 [Hymenopellis radicata]